MINTHTIGVIKVSRPKPVVLLEQTDKKSYQVIQVLASNGIWAVYYEGRPINLKTFNMLVSYPGPKYKKVAFSNPGHAINLAKKMNAKYDTDRFTVVKLDVGEKVPI
tara:strand:+ start:4214 stop:4534 length:321 start_codon:yes stop_codon:yes gene_type:complete